MQPCPVARARACALAITALLSVVLALSAAPSAQATARDWDNDGLRNRAEMKRFHTKPRKKDSDKDGLRDGPEVKRFKTKPRRKDTDRDRLSDGREVRRYKTNPRKKDTDGDGLKDWFEIKRLKTNPRRKDTDRDGVADGVEFLSGTNPRDPNSKPGAAAPPAPPAPAPSPAGLPPIPACTTSAASAGAAAAAIAAGGPGTVVCLADGSHGNLSLNASKAGTVTLRPQNLGGATLGDVTLSGRNLRLAGFAVNGDVTVERASDIIVDRNAITSGSFGVFVNGDRGPVGNVLIGANRISGMGASSSGENDLIRLHGFYGVRIEYNELRNIVETGGHSDVLQSVHGGRGLIFSRNYVHEQGGTQGFFVKDGAVTNLTVEENLIVGDPSPNGYAIAFYDTHPNPADPFFTGHGALIRRNTVWDDRSGIAVRSGNENVLVDRNVTTGLVTESSGVTSTGNVVGGNPPFINKAAGDYRLSNGAAGVTWRPADVHYGP